MLVLWSYYIPPSKLIYVLFMCGTILDSGFHPFLYLCMNRKLRSIIIEAISVRKNKSTVVIVTTNPNINARLSGAATSDTDKGRSHSVPAPLPAWEMVPLGSDHMVIKK
uniref:G-protein coupled receptors family 1 profile domain-containing protein n=1 Tax=Acrobeloides nanus TaxID=290746 RepID=A0A914DLN3_9BILA